MTSNTRRPGFRLWGADSADEPGSSATDRPDDQAAVDAAPVEDTAPERPTVDATPAPAQHSPESAGFLASLVGAMRDVAEEARETGLADLRAAVEQRVAELERDAAERADGLRRQADLDVTAVADWERSEIERIRGESEAKTTTRRQQLEQQISDHHATSEAQVAATRARLAQHETELRTFFSQLAEIKDPAAFVAAAERMPRPPKLAADSGTGDAAAPRRTLETRLADLGVNRATPDEASSGQAATAESTGTEPAAKTGFPSAAFPTPAAAEVANPSEAARDTQLTDRLAALDRQLGDAAPVSEAPAEAPAEAAAEAGASSEPGSESSTSVVVKGLGSFGAITSFKQALERVDGIDGVTLSLGPTGEFVYRASHAADFDLVAAVRSLEGPSAEIERVDGALRVSVNRAR